MVRRHVGTYPTLASPNASSAKDQAPLIEQTSQNSSSSGTITPDSQQSELSRMADAANALTQGCLLQISQKNNEVEQPILQCVQIKPMNSNRDQERYRVVMNDSINFMQGMLTQQMNYMVNEQKLKKGSIVRLTQFTSNFVKDKHILVILALDILEEYGELEKIGQPVAIEYKGEGSEEVKPQPGNIAGDGFYGNKAQQAQPQQVKQEQQRSLPSRTNGSAGGGSHGAIYPIESLSPYAHKWTIKARCTSKGEIKTWHNTRGDGKLFSANFLDESSEIRATGFNNAVDQWYDVLQEGSVYYISSPCKVQLAKKQYSNLPNDYELTFENDTIIEKAEDAEGVPQVSFNFTSLADLQNVEKDNTIDCIGVLSDVGELSEITSKTTNKPFNKRELTLVDNTGYNVRLTVWGKTAQSFDTSLESVLAFKGVKVSDFGGRSLSLLSSGSMTVDPDIEQAYQLKGWYSASGRNEQFQTHANTMSTVIATSGSDRNATKTIGQVRDENLGMTDDTDWFSIKATVIYVKADNFAYPACLSENCNKKVVETDPGQWRCEKCDKTWDRPEYRYIMSVNVSDHTGQIWLSCFDETGKAMMGMSANDVHAMKEEGDERKVAEVFQDATCRTYIFRCKAKMDNFQDQQRVRYQVQAAQPLNFAVEANKLAKVIEQYSINSDSLFVS
ncbi:Replication factor A protein 1 [Vermiconidia calcicola]|uniref:Replication factor A protein 1 n=1 Tax=Vermiconidia calcicola TaxID=1690605 RepID=A0ACC3MZL5_9PEZI|nr:Replication factor A protein 1 [Vermiconidia calcicola]